MCVRCRCATAHLGDSSGRRSHVFTIDENVHGVVAAPLHAHTVPDLSTKHLCFLANVLTRVCVVIKVHVHTEYVSPL